MRAARALAWCRPFVYVAWSEVTSADGARFPNSSLQPLHRVDELPVLQRLEVQVTPRGVAGRAGVGDELTAGDPAALDDERGQVVVGGGEVDTAHDAVVDDNAVAVPT